MSRILNILFLAFLLASCTKSTEKFTPYSTTEFNDLGWSASQLPLSKYQEIVKILAKLAYNNSFISTSATTIDVNNKVQLGLPSNNYLLNGANYTGTVTTNLQQLTTKGDFIRNLISSCNSTNLYDSKGLFLLDLADKANNPLSFYTGNLYSVSLVDTLISQSYQYIAGNEIQPNDGNINWRVADSVETGYLQAATILINGQNKTAYTIFTRELSWLNIASPIAVGNTANANVLLSVNNFTNKNTAVFAVFKDYNTVLKLSSDVVNKSFLAQNLPLGSNITLVSLSYIDGQFYIGNETIVVSNAATYTIKPSLAPISLLALNNYLDGL